MKSATPEGDEAAYTSLIVVETGFSPQYVQPVQKALAGVDAKSGKLLWRYPKMVSGYGATIRTPLADGDIHAPILPRLIVMNRWVWSDG